MSVGDEERDLDAIPPAQRMEAWRDILAESKLDLEIWPTPRSPEVFRAMMKRWGLGEMAILDCRSDPCAGRRSDPGSSGAASECAVITFVRDGTMAVSDGEGTASVAAGHGMVWDGVSPLEFEVSEPLSKRIVVVPRDRALAMVPGLERLVGSAVLPDSPAASLLMGYLDLLIQHLPSLDAVGRATAAAAALELLRPALEPAFPAHQSKAHADLLVGIRAYIENQLPDPSLSPPMIADAHGISTRTLHLLFEDAGESVSTFIRRRRLEHCHDDLIKGSHDSVIDIAIRWGFHSASHFSRAFKDYYGVSPSGLTRGTPNPD
jgi:AraC-like DNA-binding protein